ncbi:RHS repeat-associated core domain-containing protein [Schaalia canis]|uniref:RHS repeat-associated core domain-containing protein n=1 Tax=Schaalia canis TaxID=100469 RepID=UPI001401C4D9|nr:RHS repeat-associated core domain-containing protein [Schaalia canis]
MEPQAEGQAGCSGGASWRTSRWHDPANPWTAPALGELSGVMGLQISSTGTPVLAGLEWMGARPYDPTTSHFLTRDPLPPLAGSTWEANPYNYAANNPLNTTDPLGLRPVTDAQLNAYNNYYGLGFLGEAKQWFDTYGAYIFGTLAIVVGVALLLTGVGGPAGIALLAASGALIGGGSSALVQKYENGFVDPTELAIDTLIGGVGGLAGGGQQPV